MPINPYLTFDGQCEEAFRFYEQCLGGKIVAMTKFKGSPAEEHTPPEWQDKILHAYMTVGDAVLMGSDAPPGHYANPQGLHVSLGVTEPAEAERAWNGLSEGATVQMPLGETFWALRF